MHAVVVRVTIEDFDGAMETLRGQVVPMASGAPGFVAGYWTHSEDQGNGLGMMVFESEDAARGMADQIASNPPPGGGVSLDGVEVRVVAANA